MSSKPPSIPGHWRLLSLIPAVLLILAGCGDIRETDKQRFLIRGNEALARQNYRDAMRFYEEAIGIDSCYVPALNNCGIVQFEQQHFTRAIEWFNQALLCDPEDYDAILNRSNAFYEFGEVYRAEDDLLYLKKNYSDSATIHFRLGLVHAKMKDFSTSVVDFTNALELDTAFTEALINRGTTYYYLNELEKAEADLRVALQRDAEQAQAYNTMALIEIKRGNLAGALDLINNALGFEPLDPYFTNNKGYILLLSGQLEEARELIDQSIARDPDNAWAYRNKGRYYHLTGQYKNALRLYDRAARDRDFVELLQTFRGDALLATGEKRQACAAWRQGLEEGELEAAGRMRDAGCD